MADKGFPAIKQVIDESGKSITLIMPPFLQHKEEFTSKETGATYEIASQNPCSANNAATEGLSHFK